MPLDLESPCIEGRPTNSSRPSLPIETFRLLSDEGGGATARLKTADGDQIVYDPSGDP